MLTGIGLRPAGMQCSLADGGTAPVASLPPRRLQAAGRRALKSRNSATGLKYCFCTTTTVLLLLPLPLLLLLYYYVLLLLLVGL